MWSVGYFLFIVRTLIHFLIFIDSECIVNFSIPKTSFRKSYTYVLRMVAFPNLFPLLTCLTSTSPFFIETFSVTETLNFGETYQTHLCHRIGHPCTLDYQLSRNPLHVVYHSRAHRSRRCILIQVEEVVQNRLLDKLKSDWELLPEYNFPYSLC